MDVALKVSSWRFAGIDSIFREMIVCMCLVFFTHAYFLDCGTISDSNVLFQCFFSCLLLLLRITDVGMPWK